MQTLRNKFVRISSKNRTTGTPSNFTTGISTAGDEIKRVKGISFKYASVNNIFPNIPSYANTLNLTKTTGEVNYSVDLTVGQYTSTNFVSALETAINAAIADSVVIALDGDRKLSFTFSGDTYTIRYASTMSPKIGLVTEDSGPLLVHEMTEPINLIGETEVWVHSNINESGVIDPDGDLDIIAVIPMNVAYSQQSYLLEPDHQSSQVKFEVDKDLSTIEVVLKNKDGEILTLPDNFPFTMLIKVYYR